MKKIDILLAPDTKALVRRCRKFFEYLETLPATSVMAFWETQLRMMSDIYSSMFSITSLHTRYASEVDKFVTEKAYNKVKNNLAELLGDVDAYSDVLDLGYTCSTKTVATTISETLADLYQEIKDFVLLYETGTPENMNDALVEFADTFSSYWGAKLLTAMRIIHVNLNQQRLAERQRSHQELEIEMEEATYDSEELSNL